MTETTLLGPAGLGYLADVGGALADVQPAERDELLEEVREHLVSLAAEAGHDLDREALVARLGEPTGYARELRSAAGLDETAVAVEPIMSIWRSFRGIPAIAPVWAYVQRLEPAWWAVRGYLIAGLVLPWWFGVPGITSGGEAFANAYFLHWHVDDLGFYTSRARFFWLLPIAAVVVVSVLIGVRAERSATMQKRLTSRVFDLVGVLALILLPGWWIGPLMYDFVLHR